MNVAVTYMITAAITLLVVVSLGWELIAMFGQMTDSWTALEDRSELEFNTDINAPTGQSAGEQSIAHVTIANTGKVPLGQFADWDLILETQQEPGLGVVYLAYTESALPGINEWTIDGIYRDAASSTPETVGPGILDPGEEMVVLANPDPPLGGGTYGRATFAAPNGAIAKVILFKPRWLYVLDHDDMTVYKYEADGTLAGSSSLDAQNSDAMGITTNNSHFWTTDILDEQMFKYTSGFSLMSTSTLESSNQQPAGLTADGSNIWTVDGAVPEVFKYDMEGSYVSKFSLTAQNRDSTGIATDGTNIWVVDAVDAKVYKYDMSGTFVSDFSLSAANADPAGITTDGTNIWVVDAVDAKAYEYDMSGAFVSDFSLCAANADPQGITVMPR